jgi:DNA-binding IclR family transcriptional regulator
VVAYNRETESGVAAAERALAVLAAFDEDASVLTLAKLAARTGMGKSTLLRLLVSLVRTGFIERRDDGTYRIGSQAWRVGSLFTLDLSLEKILLPIMEQLAAKTRESVAFYVRLEGVARPTRICLLRVSAPRRVVNMYYVGNRLPLDQGAGGRVVRAFTDFSYREDDVIRAERVCAAWGEADPEVCAVAAPVMGPDGRFVGALLLSAPCSRHDRDWLELMKPVVMEAAVEATHSLKPLRGVNSSQAYGPSAAATMGAVAKGISSSVDFGSGAEAVSNIQSFSRRMGGGKSKK